MVIRGLLLPLFFHSLQEVLSRCTRCNIFKLAYSKTHGVLFDPDFQTPLILGESLDLSDSEGSQFIGAFSDGPWAKSEPILSMSAFQKPVAGAITDYGSTRSLHDAASYSNYGQSPYVTIAMVPSPMADQASQISDCVPYLPNEYASSYEESQSPMMGARHRQLPEIVTYSPQRGSEGTRVMVQIQCPYDLHASSYAALYVVFGSKKCESLPHFLGFQDSAFQYGLSADVPAFLSTGSPSFAVPLSVLMETQDDCPATSLQVGVYTYEQASHPSPSGDSRKRKFSYSDAPVASAKRHNGSVIPKVEHHEGYHGRSVSASYSPYLQPLPAMVGFVAPYHSASSPQTGPGHYSSVSAASQPALRVPSPITPAWSPSFVSVSNDARNGLALTHVPQHKGPPQRGPSNPTLIRTSTMQTHSMPHNPAFNPYAIYPTKAILKLNGDLDTMTQGWTKEERACRRRLVQFTRSQTGSTIQGEFKAVSPDDRAPNSICISCISWEDKNECYVTSVDTIYLLESLVAVRFTVEEKNRIRRNLEGFRPLTVSKAKVESEDFFKVIMGFPAPKPRNIEKDVKVFPWKVLSQALKKIIGKYSASYSSTASAIPTPMTTTYTSHASHGTGSDSGTEPHTANSPQSISDSGAGHSYHGMPVQTYSQADHSSHLSSAPNIRSMSAVSQPYTSAGAYSYPAMSHQNGLPPAAPRASWDMHPLGHNTPHTGAPGNGGCYTYLDPVYSVHDTAHGGH
ncbi:hypothetical protein DTO027I6_9589 [Penicillium roqueforti]|uniref:uncharacterized protein n=1 Tax=Penicillium roqueforti TaxID=5082 RepID=UPI00190C79A1|nr:uncharacterized protein LCP9604111_9174 [Penicillium roqueforti]KAF9239179.1 hypothetical protein LCP9604111_9174 [Penicillium roqueforti]KAI2685812.1 hypothetical protein CBS147355_1299 [Penicillium roqueforti]KAI2692005.1 hypothetical protein LCP963914a_99 [Penicillium roqueforti]KAI2718071.1 hypothetical protein CBS147318_4648 [Penicillium roqueforti]KAI3111845.1 hypothetical protein CBS147333_4138 [Penicillium roqueforti]